MFQFQVRLIHKIFTCANKCVANALRVYIMYKVNIALHVDYIELRMLNRDYSFRITEFVDFVHCPEF
jgi:hypothetical protein